MKIHTTNKLKGIQGSSSMDLGDRIDKPALERARCFLSFSFLIFTFDWLESIEATLTLLLFELALSLRADFYERCAPIALEITSLDGSPF